MTGTRSPEASPARARGFVVPQDGDPRLPGAGYAALHPELEDVNPEDYPDIHKMAILADVAPYSREYNTRDLRPAAQQKPRARAGEASGLHVPVMLCKADRYLPGTRL